MDMTPEQIELLQQQLVELQNKMGSQVRPGDKVNLSRGAYKRTPTPEEVKERLSSVGINDISEITKPIDDYRAQLEAMLPQLEAAAKPDPVGSVGRALSVWMANQPRELGYADMRELYPAKDTDAANKRIDDHKAKIAALQEKNIDNRLNVAKLAKDFAIEVPSMTASVSEAIPPSPSSQWDPRIPKPRPLSAEERRYITEAEAAIRMAKQMPALIDKNSDLFGPVIGRIYEVGTMGDPKLLSSVAAGLRATLDPEVDKRAQKVNSELSMFRQRLGKALEGGVLRKEDETKYKSILLALSQHPEVGKEVAKRVEKMMIVDLRDFFHNAGSMGIYLGPELQQKVAELDAAAALIDREKESAEVDQLMSGVRIKAPNAPSLRKKSAPAAAPAPASGFKSIKDWKSNKKGKVWR